MIVQFAKWNDSLVLHIPNNYAHEIAAAEGQCAEVKVEGGSLIVTPIPNAPVYDLDELLSAITPENLHAEIPTGSAVGNEFN